MIMTGVYLACLTLVCLWWSFEFEHVPPERVVAGVTEVVTATSSAVETAASEFRPPDVIARNAASVTPIGAGKGEEDRRPRGKTPPSNSTAILIEPCRKANYQIKTWLIQDELGYTAVNRDAQRVNATPSTLEPWDLMYGGGCGNLDIIFGPSCTCLPALWVRRPPRAVGHALLGIHTGWMLIATCDQML